MANYYEILGVGRTASAAEIRQAYMRLAKERHPDRFHDPAERARAESFFKELTAAYNTLGNERGRTGYDVSLSRPRGWPPTTPACSSSSRTWAWGPARSLRPREDCAASSAGSRDGDSERAAVLRGGLPARLFHCLLAARVKISYQAVTDVGRKRKGNEDSLFVNAEQNLFVVADGMGGDAAGEVASRLAVDAINEFVC